MARGRDATDVAISTTFGTNTLKKFEVTTLEVADMEPASSLAKLSDTARKRWYGTDAG